MKTKQEVLDAKQGKMQLVGYIDTENQKNTIQEIDMGNQSAPQKWSLESQFIQYLWKINHDHFSHLK